MKNRYIYILIITVVTLFCVGQALAQSKQKKPASKSAAKKTSTKKPAAKKTAVKKPAAKPTFKKPIAKAATKKVAVTDKNVASLAKSLPTDTTTKGGKKQDDSGQNLNEEIVVTTAYKPVLADAVKIRRNPDLEDKEPFKAPVTYKPLDKTLQLNTDIRQLDAMKLPKEQPDEVNNNYAKLGVGSQSITYGELYINNGNDVGLQIGGFLKHFREAGSINQQNFSKEEAEFFGKSTGEASTLTGRINYTYRANNFYGNNFDALIVPTINVAKQHFSTLSGEAEIASNYKDEDNQFIYALKLGGYAFNNAYRASENNLVLSGYINKVVGQFYAGLNGNFDLAMQKDSAYSVGNNLIRANPYIKLQGDNYKIDAGLNIVDRFGYSLYVFPAAQLEFQVVPQYIRLFAELRGDVNRSSLRDFAEINPFLGQNLLIQNSIDQLDISAGVKGMLAPGLGFKANVFHNNVKNMPLFVNDFNLAKGYNRFAVIYDSGKSTITGLNAELDYKASDDLDIFGRAEFKSYQLATEAEAWNLPKFKLTAGTSIRIDSKITVNGSLMFRGNTDDRTGVTNQVVSLGSYADISGGVDYKLNHQFNFFLKVNNLLNNKEQEWLYYPNYGFNLFGGAGYRF